MLGIPQETTQLCYICGLKDEGWEFNRQPLTAAWAWRGSSVAPQRRPVAATKHKVRMLDSLFHFKYPELTAAFPKPSGS